MGKILDLAGFKDGRIGSSERSAALNGGEAEIVFFPGVRVERQTVDLSVRHPNRTVGIIAGAVNKTGSKRSRANPVEQK